MGLSDLFKKKMKDPVRGTAYVTGATGAPGEGSSGTCKLTMVVQADGVAPTSVEHREWHVVVSKWPYPGQTLPIEIDRSDPSRIEILWDEVRSGQEVARQQAEQVAASMLAGGAPTGTGVVPPEAAVVVEQLRQAFPGATVEVGDVQVAGGGQPVGGVPAVDPDEGRIAQLERLARLRESGALSDAEFAAEKAKLLAE